MSEYMSTDVGRLVYLAVGGPRSSFQVLLFSWWNKQQVYLLAECENQGEGVKLMSVLGSKPAAHKRLPTRLPMSK